MKIEMYYLQYVKNRWHRKFDKCFMTFAKKEKLLCCEGRQYRFQLHALVAKKKPGNWRCSVVFGLAHTRELNHLDIARA